MDINRRSVTPPPCTTEVSHEEARPIQGLLGLPREILNLILRNFADLSYSDGHVMDLMHDWDDKSRAFIDIFDRSDLLALCLTCKQLNVIVTPFLYRTFVQRGWEDPTETPRDVNLRVPDAVCLITTLMKKPHLAGYVRRVFWFRGIQLSDEELQHQLSRQPDLAKRWNPASRYTAFVELKKLHMRDRVENTLSTILHLEHLQDFQQRRTLRAPGPTFEALLTLVRRVTLLAMGTPPTQRGAYERDIMIDRHGLLGSTLGELTCLYVINPMIRYQGLQTILSRSLPQLRQLTARFPYFDEGHFSEPQDPSLLKQQDRSMDVLRLELSCAVAVGRFLQSYPQPRRLELRFVPITSTGWLNLKSWADVALELDQYICQKDYLEDLVLDTSRLTSDDWLAHCWPDAITSLQKFQNIKSLTAHQSLFLTFVEGNKIPVVKRPLAEVLPNSLRYLRIACFDSGLCHQLDAFIAQLDSYPELRRIEVVHGDFCLFDVNRAIQPHNLIRSFEDHVEVLYQSCNARGVEFVEIA